MLDDGNEMKYKTIRAAAHNFGHSFVSLTNWVGDDYAMNHLARSVQNHVRWFPKHMAGEGVEIQRIRRATMTISFRLHGTVASSGRQPPWSLPFKCVVAIEDDRDKVHEGQVDDVWQVYD
jgi:hypothetical protein